MDRRFALPLALCCATLSLGGCSQSAEDQTAQAAPDANKIDAAQMARMGITTDAAKVADSLPLGSVPGLVVLPPEARVAVTAPYAGAATRVFVIEGQQVSRGQALALVRAAEPVQIRGELARAQAEVGLASARAQRLGQLAREGIIARARADEADAALRQANASLAEQQRLSALAGAGPDGTMTLRAPLTGRVAHVGVETGGPVDGMTAPFVIEQTGAYRVDLQLPERLAQRVRPGMIVDIPLGEEGGKPVSVSGEILSVAPSIDPATRSAVAMARIASSPLLVAGKSVQAIIRDMGTVSGVSVPAAAVTRIGDKDHVFVRQGQGFVRRTVTVSGQAGGRTIIASGLKAGELVATGGIAELKAMTAE